MIGSSRLRDGISMLSEFSDCMDVSSGGNGSAEAGILSGSTAGRLCEAQRGGGIAGNILGTITGHSRLKRGMPRSSELWDGMDMSSEGKGSANAGVSTGGCAGRLWDL